MKNGVCLLVICIGLFNFSTHISLGQNQSVNLSKVATYKNNFQWIRFKENTNVNPASFLNDYKESFGIGKEGQFKIIKSETDKMGMTHYRFQQYYNGIPVENGIYVVHSKNGKSVSANGIIYRGIQTSSQPAINSSKAVELALAYVKAEKYMWQDKGEEEALRKKTDNYKSTYYPSPSLVILPQNKGNNLTFILSYKMDVYAKKPLNRNWVFVDATTGKVIKTYNRIHTTDVPGKAVTKYCGIKTIITDSTGPGAYRLRETTTGGGVETYNMKKGTDYAAAVDFTDADNYWDNKNSNQDEASCDAHFGAEQTWEYYFQKFGRKSYDNNNAILLSYVHYDNAYSNAFWDGSSMTYGDGNGTTYSAFTALDVCGHEITHAVTQNTANLIYESESGALSEGFSDIFGASIEFFADSVHSDWLIGEDFDLANHVGLRSMKNPNAKNLPDTYKGKFWYSGTNDNGGVHTNCGVLDYWFYLLSDGETGTNDLGQTYDVKGLGIDTAELIAYNTLVYYLGPQSGYIDAMLGSLQVAEDIYGDCSVAYKTTVNAWYAVGIGYPVSEGDLWMLAVTSPETDCGVDMAYISIEFTNNSCATSINKGDTVAFFYSVDGGATVTDSLILSDTVFPRDTIEYTISKPYFFPVGKHTIQAWLKYDHDVQTINDTISNYTFESYLQQNIDVGITAFVSPVSACHLTHTEAVTVNVKFYGCNSLPAKDTIDLAYRINGGSPVKDKLILQNALFSGDSIDFTFSLPADLSATGNFILDAWTEFDIDTLNTNDTLKYYKLKNPVNLSNDTITFEETNSNDLILVNNAKYARSYLSAKAGCSSAKGFLMTGGDPQKYIEEMEFPDGTNTWYINEILSSKISFCVDATTWSKITLSFDLKQTFGEMAYTNFIGPGDYRPFSSFRVLINDTQAGDTYIPSTANSDPFKKQYVNLNAYIGTQFTITFETRNVSKDTTYQSFPLIMDNAYLDNISIVNASVGIDEPSFSSAYIFVFPNPSSGITAIRIDATRQETGKLIVSDVLGSVVLEKNIKIIEGSNSEKIDISKFPSGVYFIKMESIPGSKVVKLFKK